jgi:hypothetical protein
MELHLLIRVIFRRADQPQGHTTHCLLVPWLHYLELTTFRSRKIIRARTYVNLCLCDGIRNWNWCCVNSSQSQAKGKDCENSVEELHIRFPSPKSEVLVKGFPSTLLGWFESGKSLGAGRLVVYKLRVPRRPFESLIYPFPPFPNLAPNGSLADSSCVTLASSAALARRLRIGLRSPVHRRLKDMWYVYVLARKSLRSCTARIAVPSTVCQADYKWYTHMHNHQSRLSMNTAIRPWHSDSESHFKAAQVHR